MLHVIKNETFFFNSSDSCVGGSFSHDSQKGRHVLRCQICLHVKGIIIADSFWS